jgi:hypothetical protein
MVEYRTSGHAIFDLKYHVAGITKKRDRAFAVVTCCAQSEVSYVIRTFFEPSLACKAASTQ